MHSAHIYRDSDGDWILYCPEEEVAITLLDPLEIIEAAELTGWRTNGPGTANSREPQKQKLVAEAEGVLKKSKGRYFPLSGDLASRVFETHDMRRCFEY